ncbi:hypothetical protein JG687_00013465 [Phytophthora cactorum]|uniref:Glycosyl transferase family 28 C-terminal domain-containing protein n=1 Tax=Phytophthora cactorum TaxID=29920 RepID=A0A329R9M7_9STRA|nr:hypothetical protein PC112_g23937 [Phytophthora cactorum]KAG2792475.1 hypothetical protein PC111_g23449 [Phytophthora cactorum]KAG2810587.1 hypothetical protein PC113_g23750 [Phytophthora cactorum]KAG2872036.1 hypothetical protein PC114_g26599 [Phytophthora cactorum]KAG2876198.1 hypothetical protein PC115_g23692 [Phytophthora cactorum]
MHAFVTTKFDALVAVLDTDACLSALYKRDVAVADLIISHAGAGSIVDGLALKKKLVVVVNTALMDNHQAKQAEATADQKFCLQATVQGRQSVLEAGDWDDL